MSYASAAALQTALYQALINDPSVTALLGTAVYDALPAGQLPSLYVSIGGEQVRAVADSTGNGAVHFVKLSVISEAAGYAVAKEAAAAICGVLNDPPLVLTEGRLVSMRFVRAKAALIGKGQKRRIDLTFRARVDET